MKDSDHSLHHGTPTVAVRDNRGLAVRQVVYHRHPDTPADTDARITRHRFDALGHLLESIDPRLHERRQTIPDTAPNFTYYQSMAGNVQSTDSVDAGHALALSDIAGRPLMSLSANDLVRYHHYELAPLAGRPHDITEGAAGETPRIAERFIWAGNDQAAKDHNLAGQCVRHYGTAGRLRTDSVALTGLPLSSTRQLLAADGEADWQGADEAAWERLLAPQTYTTLARVDATGTLLEQTDAHGHQQHLVHDVAGQLASSWLTIKDGTKQVILSSVEYSAAGQKLREEHGNGVVTTFTYEPRTQRLLHILVVRPTDGKRLQDLRYAYDPVGNVIHLHNDAEATRFYRNQKVVPEHHYTYDTLYQLTKATGRELRDIAKQHQKNRPITLPPPSTDGTLVNYVRHYCYDRGGNLTHLKHNPQDPPNAYTIELTVSERSNRAMDKKVTEDPAQVDTYFDAAGNQRQLQTNQQLQWTSRGELARAVQMPRDSLVDDEEIYRYDASGQRVTKHRSDLTSGTVRRSHVLYLPGLELRTQYNDAAVESLRHEIIVGAAGSAQVRVLHWETGIPSDMANDSIRYSYTDLIGSVGLELDKGANLISQEEYYPYGDTAVWLPHNSVEALYKTVRYSGKERDVTGLYYYGYRYYQPWLGRWLSADPAGTVDGLNLYQMAGNNPITFKDRLGLALDRWANINLVEDLPERSTGDKVMTAVHRTVDKVLDPDRESMMDRFDAVVASHEVIASAEEEMRSFVDSKWLHIVTRATLKILTELLASAYSNLVGLAVAPAGGVVSLVAKTMAKESVKKITNNPDIIPNTDIAKKLNADSRSWSQKLKDEVAKQFALEKAKDKAMDIGTNSTVKFAAEQSGYDGILPSLPFSGMENIAKEVDKAMGTGKDTLLAVALGNVMIARKVLFDSLEDFLMAVANNSRPVNSLDGGWEFVSEEDHMHGERAIPTSRHLMPYCLTVTTINGQFTMAFAFLNRMQKMLVQTIAQRANQ
ncbi:RHS repeat domain-containing protein [Pseudomonas entomophila]|uniref:RHS repeat domain-containing protein n=2 Tax=Pseudomonas entomophila TaxID=312306 RepID=A0ABY9QI10_9PSED|nr:RHS repeat domain-containing protein [Pseudomonas entomophila]WMW03686.1 RHS repeat domain-containing protein [Pseudomonas entomophila]